MLQVPQDPGKGDVNDLIKSGLKKLDASTPKSQPQIPSLDAALDDIAERRAADIKYVLGEGAKIDQDRAARAIRMQLRTGMDLGFVKDALEPLEKWDKEQKGTTLDWIKGMPPALSNYIREHEYYAAMSDDELKGLNDLVSFTTMPKAAWPRPEQTRKEIATQLASVRMERHRSNPEQLAKLAPLAPGPLAALPPESDAQIEGKLYDQALREVNEIEDFIAGKDQVGVFERTRMAHRENPAAVFPVLSGIYEAINSGRLLQAAQADERGEADAEQQFLLETAARLEYAAQRRGHSFLSDVSAVVQGSIPFAGELALTAWPARAAGVGSQVALRAAMRRALGVGLNSAVRRGVGKGVELTAQTLLSGAARVPGAIAKEQMPDVLVGEQGGYTLIKGSGASAAKAVPTALYRAFVEVASERTGRALDFLDKPLYGAMFKWFRGKKGPSASFDAFRRDLRKFGVHGVLGENFDEEVAKIMNIAAGDDYEVTSLRELAARSLAFSAPMAGHAVASVFRPGQVDKDANKQFMELIEKLPKILAKNPEKFEDIIREQVKGTPKQFQYVNLEDWSKFAESQKKDARALAIEVTGSPEAYDRAVQNGTDIQIPTERALTTLLKEGAGFWQDRLKDSPHDETEEEAKETVKKLEAEKKREEELQKQIDERLAPIEDQLRAQAQVLSETEAKIDLEYLERNDVIAQIAEKIPGGRIFWNREGKNTEELVQSGVPRNLLANPKTAQERGKTYATPADEAASVLGFESDEALIAAIGDAATARKETAKGDVERAYQKLSERERAKAAADITGEPSRFYDAAAAQVGEIIRRGLNKAGRPAYEVEAQALLAEAFFRTMGIRAAVDPVELLNEAKLRFAQRGELTGGMDQPKRGQYVPKSQTGGVATIINFLEGADSSTFLHESGHWYLDLLSELAGRSTATEDIKADFQKILDWFGVKDRAAWEALDLAGKRPYHEKWAEAFESYLKTGKAPSVTLRSAFAKFRAWLIYIYRNFIGKLVEPSVEIRGIMDRMLATEDEIREAARVQGIEPMPADVLGLESDQDRADYDAAVSRVMERGQDELGAALASDFYQAQEAWYQEELGKIREEVKAEVEAEPIYNLRSILRNNTFADGSKRDDEPVKLDMNLIIAELGGRGRLRRLVGMFVKEGGVHPQQVAEKFGYRSADEMLVALETTEAKNRKIDRVTLERMREKYGEKMSREEIAEHAMAAVNNEALGDLLVIQARRLAAKAGKKATPYRILADYAAKTIRAQSYRQTNPRLYERAAARAAKEAFDEAAKGNYDKALEAKQKELLNRLLHREALNLRDTVKDGQAYVDKYNSPSTRATLGKAGQEYLERIMGILEDYGFRPAAPGVDRRERLRTWVFEREKRALETGIPDGLVIDSSLMTGPGGRHYKEISLEEFEAVINSVKNIEYLARITGKLMSGVRQLEFAERKADLIASILSNFKGKKPEAKLETGLPSDALKDDIAKIDAMHRKASNLAEMMDGWEKGGVAWDTFIRPMNEAADNQAAMHEKATDALVKLFGVYSSAERRDLQKGKLFIPAIGKSLTKAGRLSVALNWGNWDNRNKLLEGYGWTEEQARAIIDTLDERDMDFVQSVWDFIETFWPDVKALHKRVTGIEPEKVEAAEFIFKGKKYRGGYYPLKYNSDLSQRASELAEREEVTLAGIGKAVIGSTRHGHREARRVYTGLPPRLDLSVIFQHVQEVIHDLTHYEYVRDAGKLLRDKDIQAAIRDHYGDAVFKQLRDVVRDIAAGDVKATNVFERALNWARQASSISSMGWNLSTAFLQLLGFNQSIFTVGAGWMGRGLGRVFKNGWGESTGYVQSKSKMMAHRARTVMREVNEIRNKIDPDQSELRGAVQESYFYLLNWMQRVVDTPTWLAAYEKAQETHPQEQGEGLEDADSRWVAMADQAVLDSQGGGQIKDLAQIQRGGPLMKLFSQYYSYLSTTYQATARAIGKAERTPEGMAKLAVDLLLLYSVPAVLGLLVREGLRGGLGDDDDKLGKKLLREHISYLLGTVVGVRELNSALFGYYGYEGPSSLRVFASIGRLAGQVVQGEGDFALVKALIEAGAFYRPYPAAQINKLLSGIVALYEGDTVNPVAPLFGPPPKN